MWHRGPWRWDGVWPLHVFSPLSHSTINPELRLEPHIRPVLGALGPFGQRCLPTRRPAPRPQPHSLRVPRPRGSLLLAALQPDEDAVGFVEELPQRLHVDVLIPADHEHTRGARRSVPTARSAAPRRPRPCAASRSLAALPASAAEERLAQQHLGGAPREAQPRPGRVGARHHLREGSGGRGERRRGEGTGDPVRSVGAAPRPRP